MARAQPAADRRLRGSLGRHPPHLLAEQVGAQRVDDREDEGPQDAEEGDPEDEEGELHSPPYRDRRRRAREVGELVDVGALREHAEHDAGAADVDHRVGRQRGAIDGLAVEQRAVGRAEVVDLRALAVPEHLDVLAGDAGVIHGDVGVAAAADHGARLRDRVSLAADVEHGRPRDGALHVRRLDVDHAAREARVFAQRDRDAAGERVVLRGGVALHEFRQLVDERRTERRHLVEVVAAEPHDELVGHENAVARDHGGLRVELAAQGRGDLDGREGALEGLGERAVDGALKTSLEAVQKAQLAPRRLPAGRVPRPVGVSDMVAEARGFQPGMARGVDFAEPEHCEESDEPQARQQHEAGAERAGRVLEHAEQQHRGEAADVRAEVAEARAEAGQTRTEQCARHREQRAEVHLDDEGRDQDQRDERRRERHHADQGEQHGERPERSPDHEQRPPEPVGQDAAADVRRRRDRRRQRDDQARRRQIEPALLDEERRNPEPEPRDDREPRILDDPEQPPRASAPHPSGRRRAAVPVIARRTVVAEQPERRCDDESEHRRERDDPLPSERTDQDRAEQVHDDVGREAAGDEQSHRGRALGFGEVPGDEQHPWNEHERTEDAGDRLRDEHHRVGVRQREHDREGVRAEQSDAEQQLGAHPVGEDAGRHLHERIRERRDGRQQARLREAQSEVGADERQEQRDRPDRDRLRALRHDDERRVEGGAASLAWRWCGGRLDWNGSSAARSLFTSASLASAATAARALTLRDTLAGLVFRYRCARASGEIGRRARFRSVCP